jgi:hypothetical protein
MKKIFNLYAASTSACMLPDKSTMAGFVYKSEAVAAEGMHTKRPPQALSPHNAPARRSLVNEDGSTVAVQGQPAALDVDVNCSRPSAVEHALLALR